MKPNAQQETYIERLMELHRQEMDQKRFGRIEYEKWIAEKLSKIRYEKSRVANEALEAGVSKTRIGRAMGTSNWATVIELLEIARAEMIANQEMAQSMARFGVDAAKLHAIKVSLFVSDEGRVLTPPRTVVMKRHQGSNWGDPSYVYLYQDELGTEDADVLSDVTAAVMEALRSQNNMDDVRIIDRRVSPEPTETRVAPSTPTADDDPWAVPAGMDWVRADMEEE